MTEKIDRLLEKTIKEIPLNIISKKLKEKLGENASRYTDADLIKISSRLLNSDDDKITLDDDNDNLEIEFSEDDQKDVIDSLNQMVEKIPDIILNLTDKSSKLQVTRILKEAPESLNYRRSEFWRFRKNLKIRWGHAIDLLEVLLECSVEIGESYSKSAMRSRSKKTGLKNSLLIQLHARSCQVTREILSLLENGYADGAFARWRTLHEISVVSQIIWSNDSELSERYLQHEIVESKRAQDEYLRSHKELGFQTIPEREIKYINQLFDDVIDRYGKEFGSQYGWMADRLKNPRPTFADLERLAGKSLIRSFYKMASYNVHASPKALKFRLGSLGTSSGVLLAGASNAGLEEPGQNAAISLTQITSLLFNSRWSFEKLSQLKTLMNLRDRTVGEFVKAGRKLKNDETKIVKSRLSPSP
ncbi:MAG: DUF5677 domain-containing protein [Mesorhizobium sp.]